MPVCLSFETPQGLKQNTAAAPPTFTTVIENTPKHTLVEEHSHQAVPRN